MANDLFLSEAYIEELANCAPAYYRKLHIGGRRIDAPLPELKMLQSWIADFIRNETERLPEYVTAYEYGSSIVDNAKMHSDHAHIVTFDVRHFFHSCKAAQVAELYSCMTISKRQGMKPVTLDGSDVSLLVALSCFRGALTLGSPSSPFLANRIFHPLDVKIISLLPAGCAYSRYSDDIAISSNEWIDIEQVRQSIEPILNERGFELNKRKIHCCGKGNARKITGVFIGENGSLSIGPRRKSRLKKELYGALMKQDVNLRILLGELAFCKQVEPDYLNRLLAKYSSYGIAKKYGGVYPALMARLHS